MTTQLHDAIRAAAPNLRGRLLANQPLADLTWFRVGGPAEVLFTPADPEDLASLLAALDPSVPVTVIGLGSNLIVRDGGVPGVVVRLGGRAFGGIAVDGPRRPPRPGSAGSPSSAASRARSGARSA
ncbi:hypothetical protein GCM10007886_04260 [Methylobacterium gregans]|nr:hypothetical protein GCM10007886_04260 [Methylobacterium gregans]